MHVKLRLFGFVLFVSFFLFSCVSIFAQSAPTLSSPGDGANWVNSTPTLQWYSSNTSPVIYNIQITKNPSKDFSVAGDIIVDKNLNNLISYTVDASANLQGGTTYYWRVGVEGVYSTVWSFTPIGGVSGTKPTLTSPANGATWATPSNQSLNWYYLNPVTSTYNVQVTKNTAADFSVASDLVVDKSGLTEPNYTIGSLLNGTKYYWRVSATNVNGTSDWSDVWNFTTTGSPSQLPVAPSNLSPADGTTGISVTPTLTWDEVSGAAAYIVQIFSDAGMQNPVESDENVTSSSYQVQTTLSNNTQYWWRVASKNSAGISEYSSLISFTTLAGLPGVPTNLSPADGTTSISVTPTLTWDEVSGAAAYIVQIFSDAEMQNPVESDENVTSNSYQVQTTLSNNTQYWWRVASKNSAGTSAYTSLVSFTTIVALPGVPTNLSPADGATDIAVTPTLTWDAVNGADAYVVQVFSDAALQNPVESNANVGTNSYTLTTTLLNNTQYWWRVASKNAAGTSAYTSEISFTTVPALPGDVSGLTPDDGSTGVSNLPTLSWAAGARATSYIFQLFEGSDANGTKIAEDLNHTTTSYTVTTPLKGNTQYFWRVLSKNGSGASLNYIGASFTTSNYLYVNTAGGNDANSGNDPEHPLLTISQALVNAAAGDYTIYVFDGTYNEDLIVNAPNITLMSANGMANTSIEFVDGAGIDIQSGAVNFILGGSEGHGFTLNSGASTTFMLQLTNAPSNANISYNKIDMTTNSGNASQGISVGAAGADGLIVNNNSFSAESGDIVIWAPDVSDFQVNQNTFTGPGNTASGVAIETAGVTGTSLIDGNTVTGFGTGIFILSGLGGGAGSTVVNGLKISNNTVSECSKGIRLGDPSVTKDMTGITITGNRVTKCTVGLYSADGAHVLSSNFIIADNGFYGNTLFGLQNAHSSEVVTAENNWWGDNSGPYNETLNPSGMGDNVSDNVDFIPFKGVSSELSIEDASSTTGGTVLVDVKLETRTSLSIQSLEGKFTYDNTKLSFTDKSLTGTLFGSAGWSVFFTKTTNGSVDEVSFVAVGFTPITSSGVLFRMQMKIVAPLGGSAVITGNNADFTANGATPFGSTGSFSGTVTYTHTSNVYTRGDVDLNGVVELDDAILLIDKVTNNTVASLSDLAKQCADADLSSGNPASIVPADGEIDVNDVLAILEYVLTGGWPSAPAPAASGNVIIANTNIDENGVLNIPVSIESAEKVKSFEMILNYDESKMDFRSFTQKISAGDVLVNAAKIGEGKVKLVFGSLHENNGEILPATISLNFKEGIPAEFKISTSYKLNGSEFKSGPVFTHGLTSASEENNQVPTEYSLSQNYPNPFNPSTLIRYSLPEASHVTIKIYNMVGQIVTTLVDGQRNAGLYAIQWDGTNDLGAKVSSGTYFYRITAGGFVKTKKMLLIK